MSKRYRNSITGLYVSPDYALKHPDTTVAEEVDDAQRPTIVCLCGSTRFYEAFQLANYQETMQGKIVLSVGFFMHTWQTAHSQRLGCTPEQKGMLDELHLRKIDLADEVLILNVEQYIGESTGRELAYAQANGKRVRFLEAVSEQPTGGEGHE